VPAPTDSANTLRHVHMQPFPLNHHAVAERFGIDFVTIGFGQTEAGLGFCGLIDELPGGGGTPAVLYRGLSPDETRAAASRFGIMTVVGDTDLPKGFMGAPSPLLEPAILDEEDNRCPPGQVGQLAFRPRFPALILQEYFGKPEATRRAFANCWFHTGDAARVDAGTPMAAFGSSTAWGASSACAARTYRPSRSRI
jgi:crotonobetaine/carnitine-CoA ligase